MRLSASIRNLSAFLLPMSLLTALILPGAAYAETMRFVFMADSRGDIQCQPVNTPVLNAIIAQIGELSPRPEFIVFGGDMSYRGSIGGSYTFDAWKKLFNPLKEKGIDLYTVLGNHELYIEHSEGFHLANQQAYQATFTENPTNGPTDYDHLAYSFTSKGGDCLFIVLDSYYLSADNPSPSLGGNIDTPQMEWTQKQIASSKAPHKFFFIHPPYRYVTGDDPSEPPSSSSESFTKLWKILDDAKFDFYGCGHSHIYSRKTFDKNLHPEPQTSPPTPDWKNNVVQLLNGTCGAPVDLAKPVVDPVVWHIAQGENTYYFSVVDIDGDRTTVTSYCGGTGSYTVFDSFTIIDGDSKLILSPHAGTVGTAIGAEGSGFGSKKGKALVGKTSTKVTQWADDSIQCQMTKALSAGEYDFSIKPQSKEAAEITVKNGFASTAPGITTLCPPSGSAGIIITVNGFLFGTQKGKATLGGKNCKILNWKMDLETGSSVVQLTVPKGISAGVHNLKITNSVGSDEVAFTVK